jgi:hypothetical protein
MNSECTHTRVIGDSYIPSQDQGFISRNVLLVARKVLDSRQRLVNVYTASAMRLHGSRAQLTASSSVQKLGRCVER